MKQNKFSVATVFTQKITQKFKSKMYIFQTFERGFISVGFQLIKRKM
jgi:hypothetical protein